MTRNDVLARLKTTERSLRALGVDGLYPFGSHGRDDAGPRSDVDIFVDAGNERFYDLSNFMGAYETLRDAIPEARIGYSSREGLSEYVRQSIEAEAVRVF